jgi:hypothetical protein
MIFGQFCLERVFGGRKRADYFGDFVRFYLGNKNSPNIYTILKTIESAYYD